MRLYGRASSVNRSRRCADPSLCTHNRMMNAAAAAHKDELEKLLEDLSSDTLISGIIFVALVDSYITRLDTNCSDISARVNPPPAQIDGGLTYGTNIDSKLCALLRATQNFKTARRVFPKISRCDRQTSAGCLPATAARRTVQASNPLPGQRTLIYCKHQVKHENEVKELKASREARVRNAARPSTSGANLNIYFAAR